MSKTYEMNVNPEDFNFQKNPQNPELYYKYLEDEYPHQEIDPNINVYTYIINVIFILLIVFERMQ